jgi:hypothetical protein
MHQPGAPLRCAHLAYRLEHALNRRHRLPRRDALRGGQQAGDGQAEALARPLPAGPQAAAQPLEGVQQQGGAATKGAIHCAPPGAAQRRCILLLFTLLGPRLCIIFRLVLHQRIHQGACRLLASILQTGRGRGRRGGRSRLATGTGGGGSGGGGGGGTWSCTAGRGVEAGCSPFPKMPDPRNAPAAAAGKGQNSGQSFRQQHACAAGFGLAAQMHVLRMAQAVDSPYRPPSAQTPAPPPAWRLAAGSESVATGCCDGLTSQC